MEPPSASLLSNVRRAQAQLSMEARAHMKSRSFCGVECDRKILVLRPHEELLSLEQVPTIDTPSPIEFLRYVSRSQPVLIRGERPITVAVTPNGYADAVHDGQFVRPHEERKPIRQFFHDLHHSPEVNYVQLQNSNLTMEDEFAPLLDDLDRDLPFATAALGAPPDAVNIWIGNHLSVTWVHKDPYENLYTVISGEKHFTLFPPCDYPWLYERAFPSGQWHREDEAGNAPGNGRLLKIVPDTPPQMIPWISVDPDHPDLSRYPLFAHAMPLHVTVRAGETLYLPALYFHHVRQSDDAAGRCIAVNMWYDMDYDMRWAYFQFVQGIASAMGSTPASHGPKRPPTSQTIRPELIDPPSDEDEDDNGSGHNNC